MYCSLALGLSTNEMGSRESGCVAASSLCGDSNCLTSTSLSSDDLQS